MSWRGIEDIVSEFDLQSSTSDLIAVRKELLAQIAREHPDKSGGHFPNPKAKSRFNRLQTALKFVDNQLRKSSDLVPVSKIPSIVEEMQVIGLAYQQSKAPGISQVRDQIEGAEKRIHSRFTFPRIGSATFAVICASLFSFRDKFRDYETIGPILASRFCEWGLLFLFAYFGTCFIATWIQEQKIKEQVKHLRSRRGRKDMFRSHFEYSPDRLLSVTEIAESALSHFAHVDGKHLSKFLNQWKRILFPFFRRGIEYEDTEIVALEHIELLCAIGALRRSPLSSYEDLYEVVTREKSEVEEF